ncbi:MAG: MFS transporter, partial [Pseudobutyrivibrio ruminis]|nr:MFS transporter [Pseudobutyrivibrio ruminis]
MMKESKTNVTNPDRIGVGKFWAWQSRGASAAINFIVVSFVAIYCTDTLGMPPALVGTLLAVSSVVDAITDLFAGYLVDKTNTKWGKGRPYEWAIVAEWIVTFLMYSTPAGASLAVKAAWILVCRILINSVCTTLLSACQNPYMIRAFATNNQRVKLASFGGIVIMLASIVINVAFPIMMANIATSPQGWSHMILLIALPAGLIGIMRFFFVKETVQVADESEHGEVHFADVLTVLKKNPYVWMVGFMYFGYMLVSGMGVNTYFFTWVVGDIKKMSAASAIGMVALPLLFVFPMIMKKATKGLLVQAGCIAYILAGLILFFCYNNYGTVLLGFVFMGIASLPITYLTDLMMIDCGTYNAHISKKRMDGTIGAIKGFLGKVGGALGLGMVGWLLQLGNYDGTALSQPDSALFMIRFLVGMIPVIIFATVAIMMMFYKVDSMLPELEK